MPAHYCFFNMKTEEFLSDFLRRRYNLNVVSILRLDGYDDYNYHVVASYITSQDCQQSYCLKVFNTDDSKRPDKILAVNALMTFANGRGLKTQETLTDVDGQQISLLPVYAGSLEGRLVCVRSWIDGEVLSKFTLRPDILFQLGQYTADVTSGIQEFKNPILQKSYFPWQLDNIGTVLEKLHVVDNEERRVLVRAVCEEFERCVMGNCSRFTKGLLHGDLTLNNILITDTPLMGPGQKTPACAPLNIAGLIDFTDTHVSYTVFDLAVLATSALVALTGHDDAAPITSLGHVIAGYISRRALDETEFKALPLCIAMRLCQEFVHGTYNLSFDPENKYICKFVKNWDVLTEIWDKRQRVREIWFTVVNNYKKL